MNERARDTERAVRDLLRREPDGDALLVTLTRLAYTEADWLEVYDGIMGYDRIEEGLRDWPYLMREAKVLQDANERNDLETRYQVARREQARRSKADLAARQGALL